MMAQLPLHPATRPEPLLATRPSPRTAPRPIPGISTLLEAPRPLPRAAPPTMPPRPVLGLGMSTLLAAPRPLPRAAPRPMPRTAPQILGLLTLLAASRLSPLPLSLPAPRQILGPSTLQGKGAILIGGEATIQKQTLTMRVGKGAKTLENRLMAIGHPMLLNGSHWQRRKLAMQ